MPIKKEKNVEGGTPVKPASNNPKKQKDDSKKPLSKNLKEGEEKSEKENMNKKKGYNETPPDVPVKSNK